MFSSGIYVSVRQHFTIGLTVGIKMDSFIHSLLVVPSENKSTDWLIDWLIDCLMDWLIDWLIDWLTNWQVCYLIVWLTDWLTFFFVDWFVYRPRLPRRLRTRPLLRPSSVPPGPGSTHKKLFGRSLADQWSQLI